MDTPTKRQSTEEILAKLGGANDIYEYEDDRPAWQKESFGIIPYIKFNAVLFGTPRPSLGASVKAIEDFLLELGLVTKVEWISAECAHIATHDHLKGYVLVIVHQKDRDLSVITPP